MLRGLLLSTVINNRMNDVMKIVKDWNLQVLSQRFENDCEITVKVGLAKVDALCEALRWANVEIF